MLRSRFSCLSLLSLVFCALPLWAQPELEAIEADLNEIWRCADNLRHPQRASALIIHFEQQWPARLAALIDQYPDLDALHMIPLYDETWLYSLLDESGKLSDLLSQMDQTELPDEICELIKATLQLVLHIDDGRGRVSADLILSKLAVLRAKLTRLSNFFGRSRHFRKLEEHFLMATWGSFTRAYDAVRTIVQHQQHALAAAAAAAARPPVVREPPDDIWHVPEYEPTPPPVFVCPCSLF